MRSREESLQARKICAPKSRLKCFNRTAQISNFKTQIANDEVNTCIYFKLFLIGRHLYQVWKLPW